MKKKPESLALGAFLLAIAGLVSRGIGILYRPALARLFARYDGAGGALGIALAQIPFSYYSLALIFTSSGVNVAVSRLVAEALAVGAVSEARQIFRVSVALMCCLGLAVSAAFVLMSPKLAAWSHNPSAAQGFMLMAPALLLLSVSAVFRGLFQAVHRLTPNAVSQLWESLVRGGVGIYLVWLWVPHGVPHGAAGANLADVAGAAVALLYLLYLYGVSRPWPTTDSMSSHTLSSPWQIAKTVVAVAVPVSLAGAMMPIIGLVDSTWLIALLIKAGASVSTATGEFGRMSQAYMIVTLPPIFGAALAVGVIPVITRELAGRNRANARAISIAVVRMALFIGIPASIGIYVLSEPVYRLFFAAADGGPVLRSLSWAALAITGQVVSVGILQGQGNFRTPLVSLLLGVLTKVLGTSILVPMMGVAGASYGTVAAFAVATGCNVMAANRRLKLGLCWAITLPPLAAGGVMGVVLSWLLSAAQRMNLNLLSITVGLCGVGVVLYVAVLCLLHRLGVRHASIAELVRSLQQSAPEPKRVLG